MKKKKGFTLVELLAVIVILAIILIVAVPQITQTIDSARLGAFRSTAKLLLTQAEKQHLVDQTLKVDEGNIDTVTYNGVGTGDTECGKLTKMGNDYSECKISVDGSTGVATLTSLKGANKFAKYVCTNATLVGDNKVDTTCIKTNNASDESSSNVVTGTCNATDSSSSADGYVYAITTQELIVGESVPNGVTLRNTVDAAVCDWKTITGSDSTYPIYLKIKLDSDNKIEEAYVGFVYKGVARSVKRVSSSGSLSSENEAIAEIFGENNCDEGSGYYACTDSGLLVSSGSDTITVSDSNDEHKCYVNNWWDYKVYCS